MKLEGKYASSIECGTGTRWLLMLLFSKCQNINCLTVAKVTFTVIHLLASVCLAADGHTLHIRPYTLIQYSLH